MLKISPIMDSSAEDVFASKCCSFRLPDQNLEIHLTNTGDKPVVVPSYFELETDEGVTRVDTLTPHGNQTIAPGDLIGFYCTMDEYLWAKGKKIVFYDIEGNRYERALE